MAEIEVFDGLGYVSMAPPKPASKPPVTWKPSTSSKKPPTYGSGPKPAGKPPTVLATLMKKSIAQSKTPSYKPPPTSGYLPATSVMVETTPNNKVEVVSGSSSASEATTLPVFSASGPVPPSALPAPAPFAPIQIAPEGKPYAPTVGPVTPEQLVAAATNEPMAEEQTPAGDYAPTQAIPGLPTPEEALVTAQAATEAVQSKIPWWLFAAGTAVLAYFLFRKKE